ncbi:hypothetical protein DL93DRAFT_1326246 [Clavulina sp. PMI_390]|nr:hypothetical protein DL93DRAFT_1326246 [Clavulina sp. PMI_390]
MTPPITLLTDEDVFQRGTGSSNGLSGMATANGFHYLISAPRSRLRASTQTTMPSSPSSSSSATSSPTANTASTPALPRISQTPASLIEFTLTDLWAYVSEHEALQRAEIVSIERYAIVGATNSTSTSALSPTFHPHPRHGITRRRTKKDSRARAGGRQSPVGAFLSNILHGLGFDSRNTEWEIQDRAIMTAKKPLLTHTGFLEEQHTFPPASRPTLKALSQLSTAITQELENYRTWPETNWLFCSLIEEHLHSSGSASLPPPPTVSVSTSTQRKK